MSTDPADTFRQEASELLEQLEQGLLDLERDPADSELVNTVFRALHTIKGSGAMFGFNEVASFVHEFETAFDSVRKGKTSATASLIAIALDAKDHIAMLIDGNDVDTARGDGIVAALRQSTGSDAPAPAEPAAAEPVSEAPGSAKTMWRAIARLPSNCMENGTNPLLLLDEIREIGPCTITALTESVPALDDIDPSATYLGWQIDIEAEDPRSAFEDVFLFLLDEMELSVVPLDEALASDTSSEEPAAPAPLPEAVADADPAPEPAAAEPAPKTPASKASASKAPAPKTAAQPAAQTDANAAGMSLRVPAERLDELMDRVGELVIAQSRLQQISGESGDLGLKTVAEELERLSAGLRDTAMGIRMVPIGSLFSRFRRLIHDVSHDLDKDIDFITTGEETELDKTMIERLADPLVHLIRNAADHGVEPEAARVAAGKAPKGTIRLEAVYAGAEVAISVSDDGAGLDASRIRAKAEDIGLVSADARVSDHDLYQMIFAPGFSTMKEVTSLSGRGVGMDVVKRTIDGLRGTIELTSTPGRGTTVTLRLPLTLAIIDGMLVRVGQGRYTIPLAAVVECVEMPEMPETVESNERGRSFLDIRSELVPYLDLRDMFRAKGAQDTHRKVVIVQCGEEKVGLIVDQIIGNFQTVIKQLSKLHSNLKTFSGATILGDGTVALILDTVNLVNLGQAQSERQESREKAA